MFEGVKVLVTGGAGFIGSHLVDTLLARGATVRVLDDFSSGLRENLTRWQDRVELFEGDIGDLELCERATEGARFVFHQAARGSVPRSIAEPLATITVNVGGTATVFEAARRAGVERVVYASSSSVYGDSVALPKREGEEGRALSPYASSKVMGEELARAFSDSYPMTLVGLRYFNVYGPRQRPDGPYAAVVPRFMEAGLTGKSAIIHGDGEQARDFTFVDDAVAANVLAASAPDSCSGQAYNVGGGSMTTVNRLASEIQALTGGAAAHHVDPRPGDVRRSLADLTAIGRDLGYRPRIELAEGLERTLAARRESGPALQPR